MRIRGSLLTAALLVAGACYEGDGAGPIGCTDIFVYGLWVEVRDAVSGQPAATGARLTVREGEYLEVVDTPWNGPSFAAAGERAGTYALTVEHPSYETWTRSGVVVTADECHVTPVDVRAELTPTP